MKSKMQRRKERQKRKEANKRRKEQQFRSRQLEARRIGEAAQVAVQRHRQRIAEQQPVAWPDEPLEDVAIFDDAVGGNLPVEVAEQVNAVREALQAAIESRGGDAMQRVAGIPRASRLSEWRLFLRGLVSWLADDFATARDAWTRLDRDRRPGRIATAMMAATRDDLESASAVDRGEEPAASAAQESGAGGGQAGSRPVDQLDEALLYHAKLLRRTRFDRAAIRVAEAALKLPEESPKLSLGPKRIQWLRQFVRDYGDMEPQLCASLSSAALSRAARQNFSDVFESAIRAFPGPRHDPYNSLLSCIYYSRFQRDDWATKKADRALEQYLGRDLPKNDSISDSLRGAIESEIHLREADDLLHARPEPTSWLDFVGWRPREDVKKIRKHMTAAIEAAPNNLDAHKAYVDWLVSKLDNDRLTQADREPWKSELAKVMRAWAKGRPDDVEPRLWLVDYLLENELLDEARPHVNFLAASRQDDPRVRATPWKWQLLETLRLCRRKAWIAEARGRLDEAEALWPDWVSRQWLPYLRAALALRGGQAAEFDDLRRRAPAIASVAPGSLADSCMMLAAAQSMRASAADLKPFRGPVDLAVTNVEDADLSDLVNVGAFFCDLHRVKLVYPAYRMHGSKIGIELVARWNRSATALHSGLDDARLHKALLWCAEHRFWDSGYDDKLPKCLSDPKTHAHPMVAAALVHSYLKGRYHWRQKDYIGMAATLRNAASAERDPYYRHWFLKLAEGVEDVAQKEADSMRGNPLFQMFAFDDASEKEDGDEDLDFDPNCDCESCREARQMHAERQASDPHTTPF